MIWIQKFKLFCRKMIAGHQFENTDFFVRKKLFSLQFICCVGVKALKVFIKFECFFVAKIRLSTFVQN